MTRPCWATLELAGVTHCCDVPAPHSGMTHYSEAAQAIWISDGEARRHRNTPAKKKADTR
jgi:hypothetical protein